MNKISKYIGVFYSSGKWGASIRIDNGRLDLGRFPYTKEGEVMAALAYNEAAKKYRGKFANLNIIPHRLLTRTYRIISSPELGQQYRLVI